MSVAWSVVCGISAGLVPVVPAFRRGDKLPHDDFIAWYFGGTMVPQILRIVGAAIERPFVMPDGTEDLLAIGGVYAALAFLFVVRRRFQRQSSVRSFD